MAHVGHGAVAIVGHAIDHDRNTPGAVAFVAYFLDIVGVLITGCALYGPLDSVLGDVPGKRLVHRQAQTGIGGGVGAPHAGGDADFPDELGEQFAALRILRPLAVLDVCPLAVSGHVVARARCGVNSSMARSALTRKVSGLQIRARVVRYATRYQHARVRHRQNHVRMLRSQLGFGHRHRAVVGLR